jgi:hypothetical protein
VPLVVDYIDEIIDDPSEAVTRTDARLQPDGWRYYFPWVKTAVGTPFDNDRLLVDNQTGRAWKLWHRFHEVGMVAEYSQKELRVVRAGLLTAQQVPPTGGADFIMVTLRPSGYAVQIVDASPGEAFFEMRLLLERDARVSGEDRGQAPFGVRMSPDMPIEELGLSKRAVKGLRRLRLRTLGELQIADLEELMATSRLRKKQYREIVAWFGDHPWLRA